MSSSGRRRKSLYGYQLANNNQEQIFRASPVGHATGGATCFWTFLFRPPPVCTSGCGGGAVSNEASVPGRAGLVSGRCSSDSGANMPTDEATKLRALKNVEGARSGRRFRSVRERLRRARPAWVHVWWGAPESNRGYVTRQSGGGFA
jgi:hypothetical protein